MRRPVGLLAGMAAMLAWSLPATAGRSDGVGSAVRHAMASTGARGLAIAVIDRGRVTRVAAYGDRDATGRPLTADTVMYGASLTKAVVGYLAAQLAAEGRLDLDRPFAAMLPRPLPAYGNLDAYGNWGDLAGDERWRAITPRMALNHSTGFANFAFLEPDRRLRIHFAPGTRYAYSGEGMMLLQFALEHGLGLDLGAELHRRFFAPLGMTRTSLRWQERFASDLARMAAAMVRGEGLPARARAGFAKGTLPITSRQQFPTLLPEAPPPDRPRAAAALGVIAFDGPQGPGWYKGGHDDVTANTLVCLTRRRRCVLILSNDVRAERAFPMLVRTVLGETGVPYRWEYPGLPAY